MVKYILLKHYQETGSRHVTVEIRNELDEVLGVEHYAYGMDVPLPKVRAEVIGLLDLIYKTPVTDLGGTGVEL